MAVVRRQTADHTAGTHYPGCGPANVDRVLESMSESETVGFTGTAWCASFAVMEAEAVVVARGCGLIE